MPHMTQLKERIDSLLKSGLSLREIARRAGVGVGTIFDIKSGRVSMVTVETYSRIMGVVPNART
jgi:transcriptional regulator with XRE-family HTH domain